MANDTINIVTCTLKGQRNPGEWTREMVEKPIPRDKIKNSLKSFMTELEEMLVDLSIESEKSSKRFLLDEVQVQCELTPDGDFKLVGSGGVDSPAGIKFNLKRRHSKYTGDTVRVLAATHQENDPDTKLNYFRNVLTTRDVDVPFNTVDTTTVIKEIVHHMVHGVVTVAVV